MFLISVRNTLYISVIAGPIGFVLAFILAWIINEFNPHVRGAAGLPFLFAGPSWKRVFPVVHPSSAATAMDMSTAC